MKSRLIIATRRGMLATAQAEIVRKKLEALGTETELKYISAKGDLDRVSSLDSIGGDGLFVRRLEEAIASGEADMAVHSAKDLPFELMDKMGIYAVPDAADARDVLIMKKGRDVTDAIIGSSSVRRSSQFKELFPDADFKNIRGNITTRLEKLDSGEYDGIILAKAGTDRIGFDPADHDIRIFSVDEMVPSACQGLLAVECAADNTELIALLGRISLPEGMERLKIERCVFKELGAKCSYPVGVHARIKDDMVRLTAYYNGRRAVIEGGRADHRELSLRLCEVLRNG